MKDEKFDSRIKNLTESYSESPGKDLWGAIERGLNRRKRMIAIRVVSYSLSAAAVLIAALMITLNISKKHISGDSVMLAEAGAAVEQITPADNLTADVREIAAASAADVTAAEKMTAGREETVAEEGAERAEKRETPAEKSRTSKEAASGERVTALKSVGDPYIADNIPAVRQAAQPRKISRTASSEIISPEEEYADEDFEEIPAAKSKKRFAISAGGDFAACQSGNVNFHTPQYSSGAGSAAANYGILIPISELHHYFPVSAGLELTCFFLDGRMGVGTGVNYTYLESRYEALMNNGEYQAKVTQKFNYMGIPLNLYFNVISNEWGYFYLSLGGLAERAVGINYSITNLEGVRFTENKTPKGLQWSVNVGVGFEYRFLKFMGVYVDPRLSYFFDCNQPYSVRTEQPLQFRLELGFRFHL